MTPIRFRFSAAKAFAAIRWMLRERPGADLHTLLKACYFADKDHLNAYGRPIFGATYRAMKFGPVPLEIYEMLKGESLWLAELGLERFPWLMRGYSIHESGNEALDLSALSETDLDALETGFRRSSGLTFNERTLATHGADWQKANLGIMAYEDMMDDGPEKAERVRYLTDTSRFLSL